MLSVLTLMFLGLALLFTIKLNEEECGIFFGILFVIFLIITIPTGISVVNGRMLDSKIAMYMEENENIETEMNILVERYMAYESDTYGELKGESSITLVSLYPELKADVLVTKQLEVYLANNEKIKKLKEKKIDLSNKKWWLYFGK